MRTSRRLLVVLAQNKPNSCPPVEFFCGAGDELCSLEEKYERTMSALDNNAVELIAPPTLPTSATHGNDQGLSTNRQREQRRQPSNAHQRRRNPAGRGSGETRGSSRWSKLFHNAAGGDTAIDQLPPAAAAGPVSSRRRRGSRRAVARSVSRSNDDGQGRTRWWSTVGRWWWWR